MVGGWLDVVGSGRKRSQVLTSGHNWSEVVSSGRIRSVVVGSGRESWDVVAGSSRR